MSKHVFAHIELSAVDRHAAGNFYSELFGWEVNQNDEMDYAVCEPGLSAGLNPVKEDYPAGTIVPYVTTEDVEASLARAEELGGRIVAPKWTVATVGDLGLFLDPSGNMIGLLKPEAQGG